MLELLLLHLCEWVALPCVRVRQDVLEAGAGADLPWWGTVAAAAAAAAVGTLIAAVARTATAVQTAAAAGASAVWQGCGLAQHSGGELGEPGGWASRADQLEYGHTMKCASWAGR
eukprot:scaffold193180_cov15-Tisochrysis_lutea.AAC.1